MAVSILFAIVVGFVSLAVYLYRKRVEQYKLRDKLGIRGPPTNFILGNIPQIISRSLKKGYSDEYELHQEWHRQYGETFGIYLGQILNIVVSNEDMVKEIYVKNFTNFSDRSIVGMFKENQLNHSLLQVTRANGWKQIRSTVSPTFSTGKMKAMHETIKDKIETFLEIIEEKSDSAEIFDIYDDFQALTLDVIGKCAFAIESDCQRDRTDVFYEQARKFFKYIGVQHSPCIPLSLMFPGLSYFWKMIYPWTALSASEEPLIRGLADVYDRRKAGECADSVDVLKLLLDREDNKEQPLTKEQVVENCFAFLLAGYETTSTALAWCTYLLAKNAMVQKKLYEEIEETKREKGLTFDSIHAMKYLDAVFKESLRVYPPVINFVSRECLEDTKINDLLIPKGAHVSVMPYTVHMNENNWPNAKEFIPERFLDWNDKSSLKWIPFGVGPRFCVGMRFAEMEFKMTMARLIDKFEICWPEKQFDAIPDVNGVIMRPKDGIRIRVLKREK